MQPTLTPREMEILGLITQGWTTSEIALALGVSVRTIEGHGAALYAKLGLTGEGAWGNPRVRAVLWYQGLAKDISHLLALRDRLQDDTISLSEIKKLMRLERGMNER